MIFSLLIVELEKLSILLQTDSRFARNAVNSVIGVGGLKQSGSYLQDSYVAFKSELTSTVLDIRQKTADDEPIIAVRRRVIDGRNVHELSVDSFAAKDFEQARSLFLASAVSGLNAALTAGSRYQLKPID